MVWLGKPRKALTYITALYIPSFGMSLTASASKETFASLGGGQLRNMVFEAARFDESQTLDVDGILWTEHINLVVGSKELAEYFYIDVLGCTRDGGKSFHVNLGQQQFHLAENGEPPQRITGSIGLTVPNLKTVKERIKDAVEVLRDTQFKILNDSPECLTVRCPWGNCMHLYSVQDDCLQPTAQSARKMENLHAEGGSYGSQRMAVRGNPGIRYIEITCPPKQSSAVARFYREMLGCTVFEFSGDEDSEATAATVCVGPGVHLVFVESIKSSPEDTKKMEGVHVCFYVNDFKVLYKKLEARRLIWSNPRFLHLDSCDTWNDAKSCRTLRFKDVIDLSTGEKILELEHETRPLRHGQYLKVPLYNPR